MSKMRPRRKGKQTASGEVTGRTPGANPSGAPVTGLPAAPSANPSAPSSAAVPPQPESAGRTARVRNRLVASVAVVAAAIAGAGAPAILAASGQLNDSQDLVTLAERTQQALTLAHSLADERDEVTSYIAAGRPAGKGLSEQRSARVDRQIEELRTDAPGSLLHDLDGIAAVRRAALTGKSTPLQAHGAYARVITELHRLAGDLAERTPPRAADGSRALVSLDTAVEQASAARGLLLAALSVPRPAGTTTVVDPATGLPRTVTTESPADTKRRNELSAAAQQARLREQAALADFHDNAPAADASAYDSTVTGPGVTAAEKYLTKLTDQPALSTGERGYDRNKLDAALSARVDLMRGAEASLGVKHTKDLTQLRDDDVDELELRIALVGICVLVAIGVSMAMARTLTRPLAVLRLGSARLAAEPATEEPIRFTGRNDEFAQVVRSVNALHTHALALHERITTLEADRKHLVGQRQKMADEREAVVGERDALRAEIAAAAERLESVRHSINGTFVNLALRTLGLVERQLAVIENLEEREQDPDRLATLFKLDHFATVMRRHSENLLVLAGAEHKHQHPGAVPLVDVVRAAVSEIERYERVRIAALPPHVHIAGFAADDLSHLVAELMENATSFSPPDISVEVSGWLLENGEVMLSVQDEGIGITDERLQELNTRLAEYGKSDTFESEGTEDDGGLGLGLYVVARLAHRHGVRVRLREQKQGGVAAVVVLPKGLLADLPAAVVAPAPRAAGGGPAVHLPGSEAEANSNVLPGRVASGADPLILAAESAVAEAETTMELGLPEAIAADPAPEEAAPARPSDDDGAHERAGDEAVSVAPAASAPVSPIPAPSPAPDDAPAGAADPAQDPAESPRLTDKGLPKRTPKLTAPAPAPKARPGGVDADALRRRLGGFHKGAVAGRRDVEAEIADGRTPAPDATERTGEAKGDTVEEASS
ncbi:nitrate- and nitrite sensing domain-containing protein [Streptomyces sp. NPDC002004]